jgi:hypothetical protein
LDYGRSTAFSVSLEGITETEAAGIQKFCTTSGTRLISHAATGWRTQGTGFGYNAGVTGRAKVEQYQRFSNF